MPEPEHKHSEPTLGARLFRWFEWGIVIVLGLVASLIAFVCCCSASGLALLALNLPEESLFLYIAIGLGTVAALFAFVFVVRRLWPRDPL